MEIPKGSPKKTTQELFKHKVKKFHFLKCKKCFQTLQVKEKWKIMNLKVI